MGYFLFILSILATWRIVFMFQEEEGPGAVFERLRAWVYQRPDKPGSFYRGYTCFKCMSIWVTSILAILLTDGWAMFFLYMFSISTGAIFLDKLYDVLESKLNREEQRKKLK